MIDKEKYQNMSKAVLNKELLKEAELGNFKIIKYLLTSADLKVHANLNYQDKFGMNALMVACRNGSLDIVKYLLTSADLKVHADINTINQYGWNVLRYASFNQYLNISDFLLLDMQMKVDNDTFEWLNGANKNNRIYDNILKTIQYRALYNKLDNPINLNKKVKI